MEEPRDGGVPRLRRPGGGRRPGNGPGPQQSPSYVTQVPAEDHGQASARLDAAIAIGPGLDPYR